MGWNDAFPYRANDPSGVDPQQVMSWCDQTFGHDWAYFNSEYRFETEKDLIVFKLRWE